MLFWICVSVMAAVFVLLLLALIQYRHKAETATATSFFHTYLAVEIIWAVIPFVLLLLLILPAAKVVLQL